MIFIHCAIVITLVFLSAFFSGSETALVSLSKYRLKRLIIKKKQLAPLFMIWLTAPQYFLTTILVSNTIVNMSATSLATIVALSVLTTIPLRWVEGGVWLLMTLIILICGEIIPKIYSRNHSENIATLAIRPLFVFNVILKPIVFLITFIMNKIAPGISKASITRYTQLTTEDIDLMITESGDKGELGMLTGEMMKKVLTLDHVTPDKIMTPLEYVERVKIPSRSDDLFEWEKFYSLIIESGRTRVPVYHEQPSLLQGYIHVNDIADLLGSQTIPDLSRLIRSGITIAGKKKVTELLKEFKTGRTHLGFVVNPDGSSRGIITLEDVLEAIVGEILDEYDLKKTRKK